MEFKKYKMEDIATFSQGKQVEIENQYTEQKENMKRFLRIIDFTNPNEPIRYVEDFGDRYYATKDDLVMIRYGSQTCGKVVIGKEGIIANNMFKINLDNSTVLNRYAYYYLKQDIVYNYLRGSQNSSTMPSINFGILNKLEIEVPSIDNQKKIIKILNDIDQKIELNNEINNNLYEETVVLYKAKFAGVEQGNKTVGEYIIPKRGKNLLTRDAIEGSIPVVAGGIEPSAYHNQFNTHFPVITISASGANAGYTNLWSTPIWASDCSYIDDSVTKNVYFWYVALKARQKEIFDAQTGSAQAHIYPRHIADMPIAELNLDEVRNYNVLVEPLFKKIGENKKENEQLSQLRDTLLPKLMNGEIDLDSIEI